MIMVGSGNPAPGILSRAALKKTPEGLMWLYLQVRIFFEYAV